MQRPAVVLGLRPGGLAVVRALGRSGVSVAGIAFDAADIGFASRYLTRRRRIAAPDGDAGDERFLAVLADVARAGRPVLYAELDRPLELLLRRWDEIRAIADVPLPDDPDVVRRLAAKDTLVEEATRAGVPIPRTVIARTAEDVHSASLQPPFLVKPVASEAYARRFGHKLVRARSLDDASAAWRRAAAAGFDTVLQEEIPAYDRIFSLFTYIGRGGQSLASVVGRKLRQIPPRFGTATVFRSEFEPRVLELGQRLLSASDYRGFAHVEVAHDVRDDSFRLIEVNTRPPVWAGIGMTPDWNMAHVAHSDLSGEEPQPLGVLTRDVTWVYGVKDAFASAQLARRGELGLSEAVAPYRAPRKVRAVLARDDPAPALALAAWAGLVGVRRAGGRKG